MKINNPNQSSLNAVEANRAPEAARGAAAGRSGSTTSSSGSGDDVHLSELVRSLRALASESPERQARIDELARAYSSGGYQADAEQVAGRVIDDAISHS